MSAKVIPFPGSGEPDPINIDNYWDQLNAAETIERVGTSIAWLTLQDGYMRKPINPIRNAIAENGSDFGRVVPLGSGRRTAVASSLGFPRYLHEHTDLGAEKSLRLAADFVTAFGIVIRGQGNGFHRRIHGFHSTLQQEMWPDEYIIPESKLAVPYRAAAAVALHANLEVKSVYVPKLEFPDETMPVPPHIAALQNPLERFEMGEITTVMLDGRTQRD